MKCAVERLLEAFRKQDPENISKLCEVPSVKALAKIKPVEFVPVLERDSHYDLRRIKYFVEHPEQIKDIRVYEDDEDLFIADGNHRFMAACALGLKTIDATECGFNLF